MSDIATLGLKIDSTQATTATTALNGLTKAAGPAAAAANNLAKASSVANNANKQLAASTGLARHELINLSRQAQDVGVSLVSGQSPLMVLAQQGTQIFDIFSNSKGSIRGFGSQLAAAITPARALALGTGLVGAAAFVAYGQWKSFAKQLDDTARAAGETTTEMAKLQGAAGFKGIGGDEFSEAMGRFSREVYNAKAGVGGLVEVLRANGVSAVRGVSDAFEKAADLIKNASSDQQRLVLLQQMGLPPTMEWVRLMSQGADGIRRAKSEVNELVKANDALLAKQREMDDAWDKFWTNAGAAARNTFVIIASELKSFIGDLNGGFASLGGVKPPTRLFINGPAGVEAPTRRTVDPAVLQAQISREQATIALLAKTPTAAELAKKQKEKDNERADRRLPAAA